MASLSIMYSEFLRNPTMLANIRALRKETRDGVSLKLVIDKSGSMSGVASNDPRKSLSKMEVVKFVLRVIVAALRDGDFLTLIVFGFDIGVVMPRREMNAEGKAAAVLIINDMTASGGTPLTEALQLAISETVKGEHLWVMTDGAPNSTPDGGFPAAIDVFRDKAENFNRIVFMGIGEDVKSDLLYHISTSVPNCLFVYISDTSVAVTVAACMLANLFCEIGMAYLTVDAGPRRCLGPLRDDQVLSALVPSGQTYTLRMEYPNGTYVDAHANASQSVVDEVQVAKALGDAELVDAFKCVMESYTTSPYTSACSFDLAHLHTQLNTKGGLNAKLGDIGSRLMATNPMLSGEVCSEVLEKALSPSFINTWGLHYLRSLLDALKWQMCTTTLSSGLLPLMGPHVAAELDDIKAKAENQVAAPQLASAAGVPMSQKDFVDLFIRAEGGCFGPDGSVALEGGTRKPVSQLSKGDRLLDGGVIQCVLQFGGPEIRVVFLHGVAISERHPVIQGDGVWAHPVHVKGVTSPVVVPTVFNVLCTGGHGTVTFVDESGQTALTACVLGHGLTGPVIEHEFFGNPVAVARDLSQFEGFDDGLVHLTAKNIVTGVNGVVGFKPLA